MQAEVETFSSAVAASTGDWVIKGVIKEYRVDV